MIAPPMGRMRLLDDLRNIHKFTIQIGMEDKSYLPPELQGLRPVKRKPAHLRGLPEAGSKVLIDCDNEDAYIDVQGILESLKRLSFRYVRILPIEKGRYFGIRLVAKPINDRMNYTIDEALPLVVGLKELRGWLCVKNYAPVPGTGQVGNAIFTCITRGRPGGRVIQTISIPKTALVLQECPSGTRL